MIAPLLVLFGLHQTVQSVGLRLPWADSWLDDLLCLPLVLTMILVTHRVLRVRDDRYVLPGIHVLAGWLVITVVFEFVLPGVDAAYTADPLDAAAYGAGALFFLGVINRPGGAGPHPRKDGYET